MKVLPLTLYDPGGFKAPLRNFAPTHLILELHSCALVTFQKKIVSHLMVKKILIRSQRFAVRGVSIFNPIRSGGGGGL